MKTIFSALTLALAFTAVTTAHAAERKIGNVIAVERTIDDVYQTCVNQLKDEPKNSTFAACKFEAKNSKADFTQGTQLLLRLRKDGCEVEAAVQSSIVLVTFQATGTKSTLEDSKACLRKAMDASQNGDAFKFIVYTIE